MCQLGLCRYPRNARQIAVFQHRGPGRGGGGGLGRTCVYSSETAQGGGRRGERGAGRDRRGDGLNTTIPQLLFGGVSLDHKP